jgi:hypothetical protein
VEAHATAVSSAVLPLQAPSRRPHQPVSAVDEGSAEVGGVQGGLNGGFVKALCTPVRANLTKTECVVSTCGRPGGLDLTSTSIIAAMCYDNSRGDGGSSSSHQLRKPQREIRFCQLAEQTILLARANREAFTTALREALI